MAVDKTFSKLPYHIKGSHVVNGVPFLYDTRKEHLEEIRKLDVHEDDVFLCGYCKSGNSWLRRIVGAILSQEDLDAFESSPPNLSNHLDINFPYVKSLSTPRVVHSHLTYNYLPKSLFKGKVIYMVRNPKDVAVSYYHFHKANELSGPWDGEWDVFIEAFLSGKVIYGSWFDNVKSFWSHRDDLNILFVKYEDLKVQQREWIQRVAYFLGRPLQPKTLDRISYLMEFDHMKKHPNLSPENNPYMVEGFSFMRKGIVGDWVNLFTDEQSKRADDLLEVLYKETGFNFYNVSS